MNVTQTTQAPSAALAGPIDRDNFFAAQRRHRRAASALSALAAIAVVLVSVPLAAMVFPLLFAIVALLSLLVSAATGSAGVLDALLATGGHFVAGDNALLQGAALGSIVVLPGALLIVAIWLRSLRVLASIQPGRLVELYGARLVRTADFEERQVSNVVYVEPGLAHAQLHLAVLVHEPPIPRAGGLIPDRELDDAILPLLKRVRDVFMLLMPMLKEHSRKQRNDILSRPSPEHICYRQAKFLVILDLHRFQKSIENTHTRFFAIRAQRLL